VGKLFAERGRGPLRDEQLRLFVVAEARGRRRMDCEVERWGIFDTKRIVGRARVEGGVKERGSSEREKTMKEGAL